MGGAPNRNTTGKNRVRSTKRSEEGRQFSSIKVPRKAEVKAANQSALPVDLRRDGGGHGAAPRGQDYFDPLSSDATFVVVEHSEFWPPPSLEQLLGKEAAANPDGAMDMYDRGQDDAANKRERVAKQIGEVNHPRRKAKRNTKVAFGDDDDDDDDDA
jgi:hypothetical protein